MRIDNRRRVIRVEPTSTATQVRRDQNQEIKYKPRNGTKKREQLYVPKGAKPTVDYQA